MTISTSRTFELTVNGLCVQALELANVSSPTQIAQPAQLGQARSFLGNILSELQTRGEFARSVSFFDLSLTAGTFKYDLPTDAIDIVGTGMYIDPSQLDLEKASGETIVQEQTRQGWTRNSGKDAEGQPTLFFVNRSLTPNQVWLWPIPDRAGTIRFQKLQQLADVTDGSVTIDLKSYWMQYCVHRLAEMLAEAAGFREKSDTLERKAEQYLLTAKGRANQAVNIQFRVGHGYGSRGRRWG